MKNVLCLYNLLLIHRNPVAAVKSFVGWRKGYVSVWNLDGQILR